MKMGPRPPESEALLLILEIANECTDPDILNQLARSKYGSVRANVAQNASAPSEALELLKDDSETGVRLRAIANPNLSLASMQAVLQRDAATELGALATNPALPLEIARELARHHIPYVVEKLAGNPVIMQDEALALDLLNSRYGYVRDAVARNPAATPSILERAIEDRGLALTIVRHPNTTAGILKAMSRWYSDWGELAKHANADDELLSWYVRRNAMSENAARKALMHANTGAQTLEALVECAPVRFLSDVIAHRAVTADILALLLLHENPAIRQQAAQRLDEIAQRSKLQTK